MEIYKLKEKVKVGHWTYFEPHWWDFRWRGGKFIMVHNLKFGTRNKNDEHYLSYLDGLFDAVGSDDDVKWRIQGGTDWDGYHEVTTLYFRRKDDALMFKLAYA